jgi:hypothetical protein
VYELLCAVRLASPRGHVLALDALEHFKVLYLFTYFHNLKIQSYGMWRCVFRYTGTSVCPLQK